MPAKPVKLGSMHFAKRGDAVAFLREMLNRYDVGDRVSAADTVVLRDAFDCHPEAKTKMQASITYFSVRSAEFGTKCFWVNGDDGTAKKFSYRACIHTG